MPTASKAIRSLRRELARVPGDSASRFHLLHTKARMAEVLEAFETFVQRCEAQERKTDMSTATLDFDSITATDNTAAKREYNAMVGRIAAGEKIGREQLYASLHAAGLTMPDLKLHLKTAR